MGVSFDWFKMNRNSGCARRPYRISGERGIKHYIKDVYKRQVEYRTADGDRVFVTFAAEAEIPSVWTAKSGKMCIRDRSSDKEEEIYTFALEHRDGKWQILYSRIEA